LSSEGVFGSFCVEYMWEKRISKTIVLLVTSCAGRGDSRYERVEHPQSKSCSALRWSEPPALRYWCILLYIHSSWFTITVTPLTISYPKTYTPPMIIHTPPRITGHNLFVPWSDAAWLGCLLPGFLQGLLISFVLSRDILRSQW
jgi:hypothetical protein